MTLASAGGNLGAEAVARAADGPTLLFGTSGPLAINQYLYPKLGSRLRQNPAP